MTVQCDQGLHLLDLQLFSRANGLFKKLGFG